MSAETCATPGCRKTRRADRRLCAACHSRNYRLLHPIRAAWHTFRCHARQRGLAIGIDFSIFEDFCLQTGYHLRRGNEADSLTIDRFDAGQGYEALNIQILTRSENSRKGAFEKPASRFRLTTAQAWRAVA